RPMSFGVAMSILASSRVRYLPVLDRIHQHNVAVRLHLSSVAVRVRGAGCIRATTLPGGPRAGNEWRGRRRGCRRGTNRPLPSRHSRGGHHGNDQLPRDQWRGRAFYTIMADRMNFGYRELMTVRQLGLYAWENGFRIERAGVIKAHNGLVCRVR